MSHTHIIRNVALAPDNVIRYICLLHGNESALGLDYLQNPAQRDAVLRAISEKRLVVAGPVDLVQVGTGIMGRTPIFPAGPSDRGGTSKYWGMAATVISFDTLIKTVLPSRPPPIARAMPECEADEHDLY